MFNSGLIWGVSWFWYLVGILGIGGTIALFFLAPAAAVPLIKGAVRFVFGTRIGVGLAVGLAAFVAADIHRSRVDELAFAKRTALFEYAQQARDSRIAQETREAVRLEIASEAAANAGTDQDVKEFHDELRPLPASDTTCRVGPDVDKLRRIAGKTERKPRRVKRVPKAGPVSAVPRL